MTEPSAGEDAPAAVAPVRPGLAGELDAVVDSVLAAADPGTLLGADTERFDTALADDDPGPLAVVGPPYSGRSRVLDAAADRLDARRITLEPGADADAVLDHLGSGPLVVEGCHHLYERRIGGFEPLAAVREALAGTDAAVVTGWNATAWAYLDAVRGLGRSFPDPVTIDPVDAEAVAALVTAAAPVPECRPDDAEPAPLAAAGRLEVAWRGRTLSVPVPRVNRSSVSAALGGASPEDDPTEAVFARATDAAAGNLGVAAALVHRCSGEVVHPSDVSPAGDDLSFEGDERFCLRLLLGGEVARRTTLSAVVGEGTATMLARFGRAGVVAATDDRVRLLPAAVPTAVEAVKRGRIL